MIERRCGACSERNASCSPTCGRWGWTRARPKGQAEGEAKGWLKGEAKGEVQAARQICIDLAKAFHPRLSKRVLSTIQACDQPATLRAWILECAKLSDAAFAELVTGKPTPPKRSRTSRPSRASRPSSRTRKARKAR